MRVLHLILGVSSAALLALILILITRSRETEQAVVASKPPRHTAPAPVRIATPPPKPPISAPPPASARGIRPPVETVNKKAPTTPPASEPDKVPARDQLAQLPETRPMHDTMELRRTQPQKKDGVVLTEPAEPAADRKEQPPLAGAEPSDSDEPDPAPDPTASAGQPDDATRPHDEAEPFNPSANDPKVTAIDPAVSSMGNIPPPPQHVIKEVRGDQIIEVVYFLIDGQWVRQEPQRTASPPDGTPADPGPAVPRKRLVLNSKNFDREVLKARRPVVVNFTAEWCGPCKLLEPVYKEAGTRHARKLKIGDVDFDKDKELVRRFQVDSIPTILLFKNGNLVRRIIGAGDLDHVRKAINDLVK